MAIEVRRPAPPELKVLLLDPARVDSLRRAIRTRQDQFVQTWKQRPLTMQELHDNANIGKISRQLSENDGMV